MLTDEAVHKHIAMKKSMKANATAILKLQQLKNIQLLNKAAQKSIKGGEGNDTEAIIVEELVDH